MAAHHLNWHTERQTSEHIHRQKTQSDWEHLFVIVTSTSPVNLTLESWNGNWQLTDQHEQKVPQHLAEQLHLDKDTGRDKSCLEASSWWLSKLQLWDRWVSKNKGNLFWGRWHRVWSEVICAAAKGNKHLHLTQITFRGKMGFTLHKMLMGSLNLLTIEKW